MNLMDVFQNKALLAAVFSWLCAQVLKFFIYAWINKSWDVARFWGDGGMPSAHSATVTGIAVSAGIMYGMGSFQFAISAIFAFIVMHDAMGVRRETGKQSELLNEILKWFENNGEPMNPEKQLKELVGHTPTQVVCGFLVGLIATLVFWYVIAV